MSIKFEHACLVVQDLRKIVNFYVKTLECEELPWKLSLKSDWIRKGIGVSDADIKGVFLRLPGYDNDGPTLEVFQYTNYEKKMRSPKANNLGINHLSFQVEDVDQILECIIDAGGKPLGKVSKEFQKHNNTEQSLVYATDPEGNIIELKAIKTIIM